MRQQMIAGRVTVDVKNLIPNNLHSNFVNKKKTRNHLQDKTQQIIYSTKQSGQEIPNEDTGC